MRHVKLPNETKGFSLINGELTEVRVLSVGFELDKDNNIYKNSLLVINSGETEVVEKDNLYSSVEDFKEGKSVGWDDSYYLYNFKRLQRVLLSDENRISMEFWSFENGEAVHHDVILNCFAISFDENGHPKSFDTDELPTEMYRTSDDCYSFNDINVVREDGSKETIVGAAKLVMLTDEQKEIMQRLRSVMNEASDKGIVIWADYSHIYAFNKSGVDSYYASYDGGVNDPRDELVNLSFPMFLADDLPISVVCEDDALMIKRKKSQTEQK